MSATRDLERRSAARAASFTSTLLAATLFAVCADASIPPLKGAPADLAQIGNAMVEAWTVFSLETDALAHGRAHPALLDAWFAEAPFFLLEAAARSAEDPAVALAAAEAIADRFEKRGRDVLLDLTGASQDGALGLELTAALVRSGDADATASALAALRGDRPTARFEAASVLAAAGRPEGTAYLRDLLKGDPQSARAAARVLGRFGVDRDEVAVEAARAAHSNDIVFSAARGEIRLRRFFPLHHEMMLRRDPFARLLGESGGLYEVWLDALGEVLASDTTDSTSLLLGIERLRQAAPKDDSGDPRRRQLSALEDFLKGVDEAERATAPSPAWPTRWDEAMLTLKSGPNSDPPRFTARVSAAIAVCSWAGEKLGHDRFLSSQIDYSPITPGGSRVSDGSFSTAWWGVEGQSLAVDLEGAASVRGVWVAQSCRLDRAAISRISIEGSGAGATWRETGSLAPGSVYFQRVRFSPKRARRITIVLARVEGDGPGCIGEIRLF